MLVQALLTQPPVEALDERVLDRLPGPDEREFDPALVGPLIQCPTRELRAVVAYDRSREAALPSDLVQHLGYPLRRDRVRHVDHHRLTSEVIHDGEAP